VIPFKKLFFCIIGLHEQFKKQIEQVLCMHYALLHKIKSKSQKQKK